MRDPPNQVGDPPNQVDLLSGSCANQEVGRDTTKSQGQLR
jgi:hypothetical protein